MPRRTLFIAPYLNNIAAWENQALYHERTLGESDFHPKEMDTAQFHQNRARAKDPTAHFIWQVTRGESRCLDDKMDSLYRLVGDACKHRFYWQETAMVKRGFEVTDKCHTRGLQYIQLYFESMEDAERIKTIPELCRDDRFRYTGNTDFEIRPSLVRRVWAEAQKCFAPEHYQKTYTPVRPPEP